MDWVKLSSRYYLDPAVASLPDADSEVGFVRSLAYAGSQETGGFIPAAIAPTLFRRRRYQASVDALTAASLWIPVSGDCDQLEGWRIARWEEWQEELEAIAHRRAADRERKRREREARKKAQAKPPSRDMSADSPPPEREKEKENKDGGGRAGAREDAPWMHADYAATAEHMFAAWWNRYGQHTAQGRGSVQDAIREALRNGLDPHQLWAALVRLGDLSKPVTGGTLQFALADLRNPQRATGAEVIPISGGRSLSGTDARVAEHLALAERLAAREAKEHP